MLKVTARGEGLARRVLDLSTEGFRRPDPPGGSGESQGQLELHLD
ncbi:MAG: hypothetical protein WEA09_14360 [Gemmatimonadota bacterium]